MVLDIILMIAIIIILIYEAIKDGVFILWFMMVSITAH